MGLMGTSDQLALCESLLTTVTESIIASEVAAAAISPSPSVSLPSFSSQPLPSTEIATTVGRKRLRPFDDLVGRIDKKQILSTFAKFVTELEVKARDMAGKDKEIKNE